VADPIIRIAHQRIVKLSADLEVQIAAKDGSAVALEMLRRLRDRAAESLAAMLLINFDDPSELVKAKTMQNEVKRYDEWLGFMRDIVNEGRAYDKQMSDADRQELVDYLCQSAEGQQEAVALGLVDDIPRDA
jgi:hypothetical protein